MSSWMEEQELGDEAGQELLQLLAEAAPSLGLTSSASPSARRTSSRARSSETIALLRARLRAAVPMCTGAHRPHSAWTHGALGVGCGLHASNCHFSVCMQLEE